jgi:hypothetical protein
MIEAFKLAGLENRYPFRISGGQKQWVIVSVCADICFRKKPCVFSRNATVWATGRTLHGILQRQSRKLLEGTFWNMNYKSLLPVFPFVHQLCTKNHSSRGTLIPCILTISVTFLSGSSPINPANLFFEFKKSSLNIVLMAPGENSLIPFPRFRRLAPGSLSMPLPSSASRGTPFQGLNPRQSLHRPEHMHSRS